MVLQLAQRISGEVRFNPYLTGFYANHVGIDVVDLGFMDVGARFRWVAGIQGPAGASHAGRRPSPVIPPRHIAPTRKLEGAGPGDVPPGPGTGPAPGSYNDSSGLG